MDQIQTQTPTDYKEYFLNKFVKLFQNFVAECINKVTDSDIQADLNKIRQLFDKLNYEKIIVKLSTNTKLQEGMAFLVKHKPYSTTIGF